MDNKINLLICHLMAIQFFAKDIHYNAKGDSFYSKHLLADLIYKSLKGFIDDLKETCLLGNDLDVPSSIEYLEKAKELIPTLGNQDRTNFLSMQDLLIETLTLIQSIDEQLPCGEVSLIDSIAQDLEKKLGLVNRQVRE